MTPDESASPSDAPDVSIPPTEGWLRSVDEHGTVVLRADWAGGVAPPTFRVKHFRDDARPLASIAAGVVADLRVSLSDCTVIEMAELTDGPFGGDVVHIVVAFRAGLVSNTFFHWICETASGGYVAASLLCDSEDAPIMSSIGPALLGSVSLQETL